MANRRVTHYCGACGAPKRITVTGETGVILKAATCACGASDWYGSARDAAERRRDLDRAARLEKKK